MNGRVLFHPVQMFLLFCDIRHIRRSMKRLHAYAFLIGTLLVISVLFQAVSFTDVIELQAQSGKITLKDLRTDEVYALKGSWEYFTNQLGDEINPDTTNRFVPIIHFWEQGETGYAFGVASYRLTLSGLDAQKDYGIYVKDEASSYRLSVNRSNPGEFRDALQYQGSGSDHHLGHWL